MRAIRGRDIGLVLQSPTSALNPALRIGTQLAEAWRAHAAGSREDVTAKILELMQSVSLPAEESFLRRYPAEQRQTADNAGGECQKRQPSRQTARQVARKDLHRGASQRGFRHANLQLHRAGSLVRPSIGHAYRRVEPPDQRLA